METRIKTRYGTICYDRAMNFSLLEGLFLSKEIKDAFEILNASLFKLKTGCISKNTINIFFREGEKLTDILDVIIQKFKWKEIKCVRKQSYLDAQNSKDLFILASISPYGEINVYNSFFNREISKDNRAGVVIHEVAHLVGLTEEYNLNTTSGKITSAESVKNFCLYVNGKLSLHEILKENERYPSNDSDEMTYRTNPNRRKNGEFDFGPDNGVINKSENRSNNQRVDSVLNKGKNELLDKLSAKEKNTLIQNGIAFEADTITTRPSNKYKSPQQSKSEFKHGGFGNNEIFVGKDPDPNADPNDKPRVWGAFDAKLKGLKKNTVYTVIQKNTFRRRKFGNDMIEEENIVVIHEIRTDNNGNAYLRRIGIVNEATSNENAEDLEQIEIDVDLELLEGAATSHFKQIKKEIKHTNSADYVTRHATLNNGGKVKKEEVDKLKGRLIFSGRFKKDIF